MNKRSTNSEPWPQDTRFNAFRAAIPADEASVFGFFYEENKERIQVSKASVATPKLQKILEATFRISAERGFHAMSLRDLSAATGLSMGGLYSYIGSKESLCAMITEFVGGYFARINLALLPPKADTQARLEALIRAHIYMSELFRPWYFFVYMEAKNLPREPMHQAIIVESNYLQQVEALINDGIAAGRYNSHSSYLSAAAILSLIQDWYIKSWHFRDMKIDAQGYADFVVEMTTRMLQGKD
ncbi:MAG: TetR/AcrR family transcriptional regulator [Alcanivoracaceae bacterium]|jgi:AcrR family transcriptional regulator|nr:TetR/AcrR family transcriptional regulator [Alcanivoracaceae bacterium]